MAKERLLKIILKCTKYMRTGIARQMYWWKENITKYFFHSKDYSNEKNQEIRILWSWGEEFWWSDAPPSSSHKIYTLTLPSTDMNIKLYWHKEKINKHLQTGSNETFSNKYEQDNMQINDKTLLHTSNTIKNRGCRTTERLQRIK